MATECEETIYTEDFVTVSDRPVEKTGSYELFISYNYANDLFVDGRETLKAARTDNDHADDHKCKLPKAKVYTCSVFSFHSSVTPNLMKEEIII